MYYTCTCTYMYLFPNLLCEVDHVARISFSLSVPTSLILFHLSQPITTTQTLIDSCLGLKSTPAIKKKNGAQVTCTSRQLRTRKWNVCTHIRTRMHACTHVYTDTYMYVNTHTHTHIHTHTHKHTHTHTQTHFDLASCCSSKWLSSCKLSFVLFCSPFESLPFTPCPPSFFLAFLPALSHTEAVWMQYHRCSYRQRGREGGWRRERKIEKEKERERECRESAIIMWTWIEHTLYLSPPLYLHVQTICYITYIYHFYCTLHDHFHLTGVFVLGCSLCAML